MSRARYSPAGALALSTTATVIEVSICMGIGAICAIMCARERAPAISGVYRKRKSHRGGYAVEGEKFNCRV